MNKNEYRQVKCVVKEKKIFKKKTLHWIALNKYRFSLNLMEILVQFWLVRYLNS